MRDLQSVSFPTVHPIPIDIYGVRESIHKQPCGNIQVAQVNDPQTIGAICGAQ